MLTREARWADGEDDLFGWIVLGPFYLEDSIGLLVKHPVRDGTRAIFYDKRVEALRSVAVENGVPVRSG
jgi:hypothetical protein